MEEYILEYIQEVMDWYIIVGIPLDSGGFTMPVARARKTTPGAPRKERVLIEFPASLLKRADQAARELSKNRSELIRNAVEKMLADIEAKKFEQKLAAAYAANAPVGLELAEDFAHIDREGF
jgi:Arc/MetJ-type ribon-helix-helix transcriptional regulator